MLNYCLVHFIAASGLLHRYVQDDTRTPAQLAEAYYLLGVAESYTPRSSWIPETEFFLETAWRGEPAGLEGQGLRWLHPSDLDPDTLLPADAPVVEKLRGVRGVRAGISRAK